jgi:hypothetical protein
MDGFDTKEGHLLAATNRLMYWIRLYCGPDVSTAKLWWTGRMCGSREVF